MLSQTELSSITNFDRIIFDTTHEIQNGNSIQKSTVINYLTSHRLLELLDMIFSTKLNLNYDYNIIEKMELALESVVLHDNDFKIDSEGLLVLINASAAAMNRIARGHEPDNK